MNFWIIYKKEKFYNYNRKPEYVKLVSSFNYILNYLARVLMSKFKEKWCGNFACNNLFPFTFLNLKPNLFFMVFSYTKSFFSCKMWNIWTFDYKNESSSALQRPNTGFADRKMNKWLCHDMAITLLWRGQRNRTHITLPTFTTELIMKFL